MLSSTKAFSTSLMMVAMAREGRWCSCSRGHSDEVVHMQACNIISNSRHAEPCTVTTPKVPRIPKEASCYTWTSGFLGCLRSPSSLWLSGSQAPQACASLVYHASLMLILPERIIFLFLGSVCWWDAMVLSVMPHAFVLDLLLCSVHRILSPVSFAVHHARILFTCPILDSVWLTLCLPLHSSTLHPLISNILFTVAIQLPCCLV